MDDILDCLEQQEKEECEEQERKREETFPCQEKEEETVRERTLREKQLTFGTYVVYQKESSTKERSYHKCVYDKNLTDIMSCKVFETEEYSYTAEIVESIFFIGGCRIIQIDEKRELGNMKRFFHIDKELPTIRLQRPGPPKLIHSDLTIHVEGTCEKGVQFGIVGHPFLSCIQQEGKGSIKVVLQNERGILPLLFFGKENQEKNGRQLFFQKKCELDIAYQQSSVRLATFRPRLEKVIPRRVRYGDEFCVIGKHLVHCFFHIVCLYPIPSNQHDEHDHRNEKNIEDGGEYKGEKISIEIYPIKTIDCLVVMRFPNLDRREENARYILVVSDDTSLYATEEIEVM